MPQFSSKAISEHAEVPLADHGRLEELVECWRRRGEPHTCTSPGTSPGAGLSPDADAHGIASYVVSVGSEQAPLVRAAQLSEIVSLVASQGGRVVGQEIYHLSKPNPRTLLGKGAARSVAERARAAGATMLVLDAELSPSQMRDLEDLAGIAICDREAIILNVFLLQARTRRARIQVEMAQLEYLRPRIRGVGLDMDQQMGGTARARGPGETASELLARKLDGRIAQLRKALQKLQSQQRTQRRQRAGSRRLVLVGYTNAGKTSLMNALTEANLSVRDMPFETLDTTSRCLTRHGGEVLISDTVGFIRRMPERLLASFESTLSEVVEASLLVIVVDVADRERSLHLQTTHELIGKLGAADIPRFYVFNKVDRLPCPPDQDELAVICNDHPWMTLSSRDALAVLRLRDALLAAVRREDEDLSVFIPYTETDVMTLVYGRGRVVACDAASEGLNVRIQGPHQLMEQIRSRLERRTP